MLGLNRATIAAAYELLESEGFITGQVGRVFIDKRLDEVGVGEEGVPDLEPDIWRQRREFLRGGNIVRKHLEALVHEEHERPVQFEKEFEFMWREQHLKSTILRRFSITLIVR